MLYIDYDATQFFCGMHRRLKMQEVEIASVPKHKHALDLLYLNTQAFTCFVNHLLATEYPGKRITPLYEDSCEVILDVMTYKNEYIRDVGPPEHLKEQLRLSTSTNMIFELLEIRTIEDFVEVKLSKYIQKEV